MDDKEKLNLLADIANDVVDGHYGRLPEKYGVTMDKKIKALEIVLVALGARDKEVKIEAMKSPFVQPEPTTEA